MALEIDFLAVGDKSKSGDAILLRYGDLALGHDRQYVVLIDGGFSSTADEIKRILRDYYKCKNRFGKYIIDLAILTHPDLDHVAGLAKLAEDDEIVFKEVLMHKPWDVVDIRDFADSRRTQTSLERYVKESFAKAHDLYLATEDKQIKDVYPGWFTLGDAKFSILGPTEETYKELITECDKTPKCKDSVNESACFSATSDAEERYVKGQKIKWNYEEYTSDINETSFVILFEYDGHRILFTGDAGKRGLTEAIELAEANEISLDNLDVIKMPHHGSRKNVTPEIMDIFRNGRKLPRCYISCVKNDVGHHPSKRLVNMLDQKDFKVYTTSGANKRISFGAPAREEYKPHLPLKYFPSMEK